MVAFAELNGHEAVVIGRWQACLSLTAWLPLTSIGGICQGCAAQGLPLTDAPYAGTKFKAVKVDRSSPPPDRRSSHLRPSETAKRSDEE